MAIESAAQRDDRVLAAYGTLAAIGQAFGKHGNKTMDQYAKGLGPARTTSPGRPHGVAELRRRIHGAMNRGEI